MIKVRSIDFPQVEIGVNGDVKVIELSREKSLVGVSGLSQLSMTSLGDDAVEAVAVGESNSACPSRSATCFVSFLIVVGNLSDSRVTYVFPFPS